MDRGGGALHFNNYAHKEWLAEHNTDFVWLLNNYLDDFTKQSGKSDQ